MPIAINVTNPEFFQLVAVMIALTIACLIFQKLAVKIKWSWISIPAFAVYMSIVRDAAAVLLPGYGESFGKNYVMVVIIWTAVYFGRDLYKKYGDEGF